MNTSTAENESILREGLERWRVAVDAHEPEGVAAVFAEDAIFQGTHPYSVGRPGVAEYYDSMPLGMKAQYRILETRRLADDVLLGYVSVEFTFTDKDPLPVHLGVVLKRESGAWYISHYQVTRSS
jgi:uncharacterized protein (TIGR02246 family)